LNTVLSSSGAARLEDLLLSVERQILLLATLAEADRGV
jgi:hypothetical protein